MSSSVGTGIELTSLGTFSNWRLPPRGWLDTDALRYRTWTYVTWTPTSGRSRELIMACQPAGRPWISPSRNSIRTFDRPPSLLSWPHRLKRTRPRCQVDRSGGRWAEAKLPGSRLLHKAISPTKFSRQCLRASTVPTWRPRPRPRLKQSESQCHDRDWKSMSLRVQTQAETTKTSTKTSVVETIKYQTSKFGSRLMSENFSRPRLKHSIDGTTRLCLTHALKPTRSLRSRCGNVKYWHT